MPGRTANISMMVNWPHSFFLLPVLPYQIYMLWVKQRWTAVRSCLVTMIQAHLNLARLTFPLGKLSLKYQMIWSEVHISHTCNHRGTLPIPSAHPVAKSSRCTSFALITSSPVKHDYSADRLVKCVLYARATLPLRSDHKLVSSTKHTIINSLLCFLRLGTLNGQITTLFFTVLLPVIHIPLLWPMKISISLVTIIHPVQFLTDGHLARWSRTEIQLFTTRSSNINLPKIHLIFCVK